MVNIYNRTCTIDNMAEIMAKEMAIRTGQDYINSLKGRKLTVYLFGEKVQDPVEHPMIRPSINAVAETYDLAVREEEIASAQSAYRYFCGKDNWSGLQIVLG